MAKEEVAILHRWFEELWNCPWSVPDCHENTEYKVMSGKKSSSRSYYNQYDIWYQEGNYKRPPEPLAESVKDFVQANQLPSFAIGDAAETHFLELARAHKVMPKRILAGAFDPKRADNFAFYPIFVWHH